MGRRFPAGRKTREGRDNDRRPSLTFFSVATFRGVRPSINVTPLSGGREKGTESAAIKVIDRACHFDCRVMRGSGEGKAIRGYRLIDGDYHIGAQGYLMSISRRVCVVTAVYFSRTKIVQWERNGRIVDIVKATHTR